MPGTTKKQLISLHRGADRVGIFIYPYGSGRLSMEKNIPLIFSSLKKYGWDINKTPLIGVAQSYGGKNGYTVPSSSQVEAQTKAFCEYGASGILYFDFRNDENASNNTEIQKGIKSGIAACKTIWGGN